MCETRCLAVIRWQWSCQYFTFCHHREAATEALLKSFPKAAFFYQLFFLSALNFGPQPVKLGFSELVMLCSPCSCTRIKEIFGRCSRGRISPICRRWFSVSMEFTSVLVSDLLSLTVTVVFLHKALRLQCLCVWRSQLRKEQSILHAAFKQWLHFFHGFGL